MRRGQAWSEAAVAGRLHHPTLGRGSGWGDSLGAGTWQQTAPVSAAWNLRVEGVGWRCLLWTLHLGGPVSKEGLVRILQRVRWVHRGKTVLGQY